MRTYKPKKMAYAEMAEELRASRRAEYLEMIGLQMAINNEWDYVAPTLHDNQGGSYVFRLGRSTQASGGFIATTFHYDGQRDTTSITNFDDFFSSEWWHRWPPEWFSALEKLRQVRDQKIQESEAA